MKIIYITATFPYDAGEAFIGPEVVELLRSGHELCIVPRSPRRGIVHRQSISIVERTIACPLVSWGIIGAALAEIRRNPGRTLGALGLLLRSRTLLIFLKNLAVYPKGLWLARLARWWGAQHIHCALGGDHRDHGPNCRPGIRHLLEFHGPPLGHRREQPAGVESRTGQFARFISEHSLQMARSLGGRPAGKEGRRPAHGG